jgi:redox-sensitive bicupin YhaK (pirin superfamily)
MNGKLDNTPKPSVELVIVPRTADLGGFVVERALPFRDRRMVGPFIFWDQMGSGNFMAGQGLDVRPHPHIGLSTVTYLFDGSLDHKDSLGNQVRIVPGDVNLMSAGSGIVHSERTGMDIRQKPSRLFGIQSWLAQPKEYEEQRPTFVHAAVSELPAFDANGIKGRVILGEFEGLHSPIIGQWPMFYIDVYLEPGVSLPILKLYEERALYLVAGTIEIDGNSFTGHQMIVLRPNREVVVKAVDKTHLTLLGGATMDGPRYIYWNFVSSNKERLEQAKQDWAHGHFAKIPGDEKEFIPLPGD